MTSVFSFSHGAESRKKLVTPDQKLLKQQRLFLSILLQKPNVGRDIVDLMNAHAPLNPARYGDVLVEGEVVASLLSQEDQNLLEGSVGFIRQLWTWR